MHRYFGKLLRSLKIATIGPKTKETLEKKGIKVSLVPDEYKAENLAECLINQGIEGKKVLLVRASTGRQVLPKKLKKHCIVKDVILYDVIAPRHVHMKEVMKADAVIFTSSRSVKNLYAAIGKELKQGLKNVKVCAIGPITARTLEDFGIKVDVVPSEYTVEACLEALR
jgi:uroporphyrinogen III methyltransferase/synthase